MIRLCCLLNTVTGEGLTIGGSTINSPDPEAHLLRLTPTNGFALRTPRLANSSTFTNCQLILLTISIHKSSSPTFPTLATVNQQFLIPSPLQPPNLCVGLIPTSFFDTPDPKQLQWALHNANLLLTPTLPPSSINQKEPVSINCVEGEGISSVRWNNRCWVTVQSSEQYIIFRHVAGELYSTQQTTKFQQISTGLAKHPSSICKSHKTAQHNTHQTGTHSPQIAV
jgi:hypothetical protein